MKTFFLSPPFQDACRILLQDGQSIRPFQLKYGAYFSAKPPHDDKPMQTIDLSASPTPLSELDRRLFEHPTYADSILALHGAAVEWNGKAHLFLAATTSGKTTLTSYLTSNGFGYLTDDCILLGREDFWVHPYTTPIQLRDGGLEVLRAYAAEPEGLELLEEENALRRFVYTPQNCAEEPLPLASIFFIERTEHENAVIDMSVNERMTALMRSPITNYRVDGDYLRLLSRLARVDCQILRYCDMNFVKELIQRES